MDDQVPKELASSLNEQQLQELLRLHGTRHLGRLLDLVRKRSTIISEIFETYEDEDVDPVLEHMSDLHIRKVLFWRLTSIIRRHKLPFGLDMTILALFMVAPVDMLRFRLDKLEKDIEKNNWAGVHEFIDKCSIAVAGIQEFVNIKGRQVKGCGNDIILRSAKLCTERNRNECIIADSENPVVVPIFPFDNLGNTSSTLETFWGTETATRLSALIQDQNILESPQNLLSLDRLTGWSFNRGYIAFKPLYDTATGSIELQLHWLKKGRLKPGQLFRGDIWAWRTMMSAGIASNEGIASKDWESDLAYHDSFLRGETAYTFPLRQDSEIEPPSFELLQLSWDMLRVAVICGATKPPGWGDEYIDDDDGDGDGDDAGYYRYDGGSDGDDYDNDNGYDNGGFDEVES